MSDNDNNIELEQVLSQVEEPTTVDDDSLKVEFDQALATAAEERARTPFLVAAQNHAMIWNGFAESVSALTSSDLKRIIMYLTGYPFYVKEFDGNNSKAAGVCYRASKLVEAKSAMILCKAIEQEARIAQALDAQEALVEKLDPANFVNNEESRQEMNDNLVALGLASEDKLSINDKEQGE
jgi:hypothetical protein